MVFTSASKFFITTFLLFVSGYLCHQASCDNYYYVFLTSNGDNGFYVSELNAEVSSSLQNSFSNFTIHTKTRKATVNGGRIRRFINILGNLGYRIYNNPIKCHTGEWILEKKMPANEHLMNKNLTTESSMKENTTVFPDKDYNIIIQ